MLKPKSNMLIRGTMWRNVCSVCDICYMGNILSIGNQNKLGKTHVKIIKSFVLIQSNPLEI